MPPLTLKLFFCLVINSKMSISKWCQLWPHISKLHIYKSFFQNSCGYHVTNFQGCWIQVRSSSLRAPEPEKLAKTKWSLTYGTPCRKFFLKIHETTLNINWMLIFSFTHGASLFIPWRQKRRRRRTRTSDKVTNQVTGDSGFTLSIVIICSTNNNVAII